MLEKLHALKSAKPRLKNLLQHPPGNPRQVLIISELQFFLYMHDGYHVKTVMG